MLLILFISALQPANALLAVALLQEAFDRHQDIPSLAKNLARVQYMAGDEPAARSTLTTALIYSPEVDDVRELLTRLRKCGPAGAKWRR